MARETFEDQAAAVRHVLNSTKLGKADRRQLECAAHNLNAFGAFRQRIVDLAESGTLDDEADTVAEEVLKLLYIPVTE